VHLGAPGVDIVSTTRNGGYAFENGTSMAAPHVAGTAALMLAVNSALTVADLKAGILNNVDPLPSLAGLTVTGGRLNANLAVRSVVSFTVSAVPTSLSVKRNASGTYGVQVGALDGFADPVLLSVTGLPANCTATFVPPAVTGSGTSELTIQTQVDTPKGTFALSINGTSGAVSHNATVTLTVK
jgi:serine protease